LLSKYENFTLEGREKFEEFLSFGKARGEGEHRGFLELCNYTIPSMILFLIASQDYILIPYQKDGKWGLADINGRVVVEPKYDGVGISHGYEAQSVSIPIIRKSQENTSIIGVVKLRYDPPTSAWTYYDTLQALKLGWSYISSFIESFGVDADKIFREVMMKIFINEYPGNKIFCSIIHPYS
jgi:hypothetical protein